MNHDELYKALCKVPSGKEKSRDRIIIELYMRVLKEHHKSS